MRNHITTKRNKSLLKRMIVSLLCIAVLLPVVAGSAAKNSVLAEEEYHYTNEQTGYQASIDDMAGTFDESMSYICKENLEAFTEYGNAIVLFTDDADSVQSEAYYQEKYGYGADYDGYVSEELLAEHPNADGVLLCITPDRIWMYTFGSVKDVIGSLQIDSVLQEAVDLQKYYGANSYEYFIRSVFTDLSSRLKYDQSGGEQGEYDSEVQTTEIPLDALQNATDPLTYGNETTGYWGVIEDDADLLTEEQEKQLLSEMQAITTYGNVAFKTIDQNSSSTSYYAENYLHETFGYGISATVFLIDMDNRNIYVYSDGAIYRVITNSYADTITDNVYRYASNADYYGCASKAFEQITMLLQGQKINQPMKYISNTLLGIILALLINYFLVRAFSRAKSPSGSEVMQGIFVRQDISNFNSVFDHQTRRYSPQSSGGGGGGHGGGGHSGGGGGHRF